MRPRETGDVSTEVWKSKMAAGKREDSPTKVASAHSSGVERWEEDLENFCVDQPAKLAALSLCFCNNTPLNLHVAPGLKYSGTFP